MSKSNIGQEEKCLLPQSKYLKKKYYERLAIKFNDPQTDSETCWSILKTFLNGIKIPVILSLLENNKLITDFKLKANLLNDFFN